ncbi:MAG: type II secretion system protein [Bilophila wadsworthia]
MRSDARAPELGFTLLEIVCTLVILGVLGSLVFSGFGTAITGIRRCGSRNIDMQNELASSASGKSLREPPIFPSHLSKTALPSHSRRRMARRQPSAAKIPETSCSSTAKYSSRTWPHAVSPRTGPAPPTSASC